jgi:choline kinase
MKAIILAAGVGKRLQLSPPRPKCMLPFDGETLIARYIRLLLKYGLDEIALVVGYEREVLLHEVAGLNQRSQIHLTIIENEAFQRGSVLSLWHARGEFHDDVLIMDADVFFEEAVLAKILETESKNCLLLDETVESTGEEMMISALGGRAVSLARKPVTGCDLCGEGVGFLRLCSGDAGLLTEILDDFVARGKIDADYEDAIHELLGRCRVGYERVGGLLWREIDFPEDVAAVETEILPLLRSER